MKLLKPISILSILLLAGTTAMVSAHVKNSKETMQKDGVVTLKNSVDEMLETNGSYVLQKEQFTTKVSFAFMDVTRDDIREAAEAFLPQDAQLVSPKQSELEESVVQIDLDHDGIDEIAAFYKDEEGIGVLLLGYQGSEWRLLKKITGNGDTLDYVGFVDLDMNDQVEVLIGGAKEGQNNILTIYSKAPNGNYNKLYNMDYKSFSVGDLDGDGIIEIAAITQVSKEVFSAVKLEVYHLDNNSYHLDYETELRNGEYPDQVLIGRITEDKQGIIVDMSLGAHTGVTEILVKEDGNYRYVLPQGDEYNSSITLKPYPLYSRDINNDGIIEIGIHAAPLGAEKYSMADTPWIHNWYQWDGKDGLTQVMEEYSDYQAGYQFVIPEEWHDIYTIDKVHDGDETTVHFTYLGNNEKAELMVLRYIPRDIWEKNKEIINSDTEYIVFGQNSKDILIAEVISDRKNLKKSNIEEYEKLLLEKENIRTRFTATNSNTVIFTDDNKVSETDAMKIIEATAEQLIQAISEKDTSVISEFVHPVKGVRFTPYLYVSQENDTVIDKDEIKGFFEDLKEYLWGYYDGSGYEIKCTPSKYYEEFIYSSDFQNATEIGYNVGLSIGNSIENQYEVYDYPIIVEYYIPGSNDYMGMDWESLRLVFEQYEDSWKLVGVIHNEWTI